jgi:hypothetical protein
VTAPAAGVLTAVLLQKPAVHRGWLRWLAGDGGTLRDGEADLRVAAGETVYLEVRSTYYDSDAEASPELFRLRVDFEVEKDDYEPNDSLDTARDLPLDQEIAVHFSPRGDLDHFRLTAATDTRFGIEWLSIPEGYRPSALWLDAQGRMLDGSSLFQWVRRGDVVFLQLADGRAASERQVWPAPLVFRVNTAADSDPFEPNDRAELATAMAIDRRIKALLLPGDVDWFAFTAGGASILADLDPREGLALRWFDAASGRQLGEGTTVVLPMDSRRQLLAVSLAAGSPSLSYQLVLRAFAGAPPGTGFYPQPPPGFQPPEPIRTN